MIGNPAYKGEPVGWANHVVNPATRTQEVDYANGIRLRDEVCPPLVFAEVWAAAQLRLTENKRLSIQSNKEPESTLLRGFARCGVCGRALYAKPVSSNGYSYRH